MSVNEFECPIFQGVCTRENWKMFEMPLDVLGKLLNRRVATLGLFPQSHEYYVVEITGEQFAQFLRSALPACGNFGRI